ncbi:Uncharacterised protein [Klebsiella pneumoniae]|nr:Uncharacterised protein [Klebsiella pneumoniae]
MGKAEVALHFGDRESPGMVGHRHPVAGNRACDGDTTFVDRYLMLLEIDAHHCLQTGVIEPGIGLCARDLSTRQIT